MSQLTTTQKNTGRKIIYSRITRRNTEKDLEKNPYIHFPNNIMYNIINDRLDYRTIIETLYFARDICSLEEMTNYISRYLEKLKKENSDLNKASVETKILYQQTLEFLEVIKDKEQFMKLLEEMECFDLVEFRKDRLYLAITPNSTSYVTQTPNKNGRTKFIPSHCKKGDFILRIAYNYNFFHDSNTCINRESRLNKHIFKNAKRYVEGFKVGYCYDLTQEEEAFVENAYEEYLATCKYKKRVPKYTLEEYKRTYGFSKDVAETIRKNEFNGVYCFSMSEGIFAFNLNLDKNDITEFGFLEKLNTFDMINHEHAFIFKKDKSGNKKTVGAVIKKHNFCAIADYYTDYKRKNGEENYCTKTIFIDKEYETRINELLEEDNGVRDTLYYNNILLKFV